MKNLLLTPGPTQLLPEVCESLGKPIIHHRTPQFQQHLKDAQEGLQVVLKTKNPIYFFAASGTGAMEASVCNLLSPNDQVITIEGGKLGERWTEICEAHGIKTHVIKVEWGKAVDPKEIQKLLDAHKGIRAVVTTFRLPRYPRRDQRSLRFLVPLVDLFHRPRPTGYGFPAGSPQFWAPGCSVEFCQVCQSQS